MNKVLSLKPKAKAVDHPAEGTRRLFDDQERVFYDGYWIKTSRFPPILWKPRSA